MSNCFGSSFRWPRLPELRWFCRPAWLGIFMVIGCSPRDQDALPAKREGELEDKVVIYSPHGKDMLSEFEALFEKHHPAVDVQWLDMGSQDILDRVRSERSNPQGDVWWGAPSTMFITAAKEGLLQPYRPSWWDRVEATARDSQDLWFGTFLTPEVIAFNTQVLTRETAPQDWDALLDPRWKGKIILRYPLASGTMRAVFSAMIWRFYHKTGRPDEGYHWLLRLDANTKGYAANPTLLYLRLARREALLTIWNLPDIVLQRELYNYPFDYVIPASGTPLLTEGIAIIAGAKHPKAAKAFYEFVTTLGAFTIQANKYYRIPTRKDIPREALPLWMTREPIPAMDIDWQVFAEKSAEWMRYWDENIKGRGPTE